MTIKRTGGPSTAAGKAIVSKNAFKHGATATQLLTPEQKQRYESLLAALQRQYPSQNPLIQLQLERIARLTVQLERIQMVMDASFQKSRLQTDVIDNLMNALEFDEEQKRLVTQIVGEAESTDRLFNSTHITLENEFFTLNFEDLSLNDHEQLLKNAPNLCQALYKKASMLGLSIEQFLSEHLINDNQNLSSENLELDDIDLDNHLSNQVMIEQGIKTTDFTKLLHAVNFYMEKYTNSLKIKMHAAKLNSLCYPESQSIMPDLDQLDKLMRYQTTLQRQLSTCIGELLALTKKSGKSIPIDSLDLPED